MRRGIIAMSPFFVAMCRIMGVAITLVGGFLLVVGIAAGGGPNLVLSLVSGVIVAVGALIIWGGPRYARVVRRYQGADS